MLWTTIVFVLVTALFISAHIRRTHCASQPKGATPFRRCPRCGAENREGAPNCPQCGVPQQIFELAAAPVAISRPIDPSEDRAHAVVRADQCVGCGACIAACPEPGALRMEHKLAMVVLDLCKGHGKCADACPVGAITVGSGASARSIEVPQVGADFQTNVPGIYLVGELGGRGLIRNAVNEGRAAIESIVRDLRAETQPTAPSGELLDVLVVGSGPAGLSAGLEALRSGLRYVILEQGAIADTVRKYPRHKILMAEPVRIPFYGELWVGDATKESLLHIWETIIQNTGLAVLPGHQVTEIEREAGCFSVYAGQRRFRTRRVVLAMGRRGTPRRLGVPGEELDKVLYNVIEMEAFAGQRLLVVGGGDSALESALGLARQAGTEVTLCHRKPAFERVAERNRRMLTTAAENGRIRLLLNAVVREIYSDHVELEVNGRSTVLPNDVVIVRVGGEAPTAFLERAGIRMIRKELASDTGEAEAKVG